MNDYNTLILVLLVVVLQDDPPMLGYFPFHNSAISNNYWTCQCYRQVPWENRLHHVRKLQQRQPRLRLLPSLLSFLILRACEKFMQLYVLD